MLLDESEKNSDYIEDCEVCCRPIEIEFKIKGERVASFEASRMDGI